MGERIQTGATVQIEVPAYDSVGAPYPGLADLYIRVHRKSDNWFLDWNDNTFKAAGWTTQDLLLTEVDATNEPGLYEVSGGWDTSTITNAAADDVYIILPLQSPGTDAVLPGRGEVLVGGYVDDVPEILTDTAAMQPTVAANLDAAVSTRAVPGDAMDLVADSVDSLAVATTGANEIRNAILLDATAFNGADIAAIKSKTDNLPLDPASKTNVDANEAKIDAIQTDVTAILTDTDAIDARLPSDPAGESLQQAAHTQTQADIAALNNLSSADVQGAMTAQGYTAVRAPNLDNADVATSTREAETDAASRAATNQTEHDATQASISGLNDIDAQGVRDAMKRAPTVGAPAAGSVDEHLDEIFADTGAIDGRLPPDPADESSQTAQHATTVAAIAALNDPSAAAIAAEVDTVLTAAHGSGDWTTEQPAGANTITITVEDQDTNPVAGVSVAVYDATNTTLVKRSDDSDLDGVVAITLDDGTYKVRISALRFDPDNTPETLTVTGDAAVTYSGTLFEVPSSPNPALCTVYGFTTDAAGTAKSGETIVFIGEGPIGVSGNQITAHRIEVTSGPTDDNPGWEAGYFEVDLIRLAEVRLRSNKAKLTNLVITIPDAASALLTTLTEAAK